jgi:hypothetical protein
MSTPDHLLLDGSPNIGPIIYRWEPDKFKNCWNKNFRTSKIMTLSYQQYSKLSISQRDMSGPRFGARSNNRWSGSIYGRYFHENMGWTGSEEKSPGSRQLCACEVLFDVFTQVRTSRLSSVLVSYTARSSRLQAKPAYSTMMYTSSQHFDLGLRCCIYAWLID